MFFLQKLFNTDNRKLTSVVVVSGLPRSGTSMMMQILEAGGVKPITDNVRITNQDNTNGYYEHEEVKALERGQHECLDNAEGRAIKVVSNLLKYLPADRHYKVIFMQRNMEEVLASQKQMLSNLGSAASQNNDQKLRRLYTSALAKTRAWLLQQKHIDTLYLDYADVIERPKGQIRIISDFLGLKFNRRRVKSVVDQSMRHHTIVEDTQA